MTDASTSILPACHISPEPRSGGGVALHITPNIQLLHLRMQFATRGEEVFESRSLESQPVLRGQMKSSLLGSRAKPVSLIVIDVLIAIISVWPSVTRGTMSTFVV